VLIAVDERDPRPLYAQIVAGIKEEIRRGRLLPGEGLPSVRELAEALGLNLHTVHHAYRLLRDEGVIHLRLGRRARVAPLREKKAGRGEVEARLGSRLRELATEAFHLGLSPEDFRALVDEVLGKHPRRIR